MIYDLCETDQLIAFYLFFFSTKLQKTGKSRNLFNMYHFCLACNEVAKRDIGVAFPAAAAASTILRLA